jgi:alkylated DNA repair dioxygenase AlkB
MIKFPLLDAEIYLYEDFFTKQESKDFFLDLKENISWQQRQIKFWGKLLDEPRLTAWYGDDDASYSYSGIHLKPIPWTNTLLTIKQKIENFTQEKFNSVLLNLYRNGYDSMGWHSDDERELGQNPIIGSISFGATRKFQLKHKKLNLSQDIELNSGSFLLMKGSTQHFWKHQIPKTKKLCSQRINLTFRLITVR